MKTKTPKDILDTIFSWYIRFKYADDNGFVECFTCNSKKHWTEIQNGHYISRTHLSTRFLEKNCHPQCYSCNIMRNGNMDEYALRLTKKYGNKILTDLNKLKHKELKLSKEDYKKLIKKYAIKLRKIIEEKSLYFDFSKLDKLLQL